MLLKFDTSDTGTIICMDKDAPEDDNFLCSIIELDKELQVTSYTGDKYILPYPKFDPYDKEIISDLWVIISGKVGMKLLQETMFGE